MVSQSLRQLKTSILPNEKATKDQIVTVRKETVTQVFSPEQELEHLIESGEWEILPQATAFVERSPEGQIQALTKALDQRIRHLEKTLNYLVNRGPRQRQAAMNVLQRIGSLRAVRDEIMEQFYSKGQIALPDEAKTPKIDFY